MQVSALRSGPNLCCQQRAWNQAVSNQFISRLLLGGTHFHYVANKLIQKLK
ncbi:hypothetical protein HMPREF9104_02543 [Lentilactobacillus kisonensis F0435]|uniref:Uncharacterized protein n=1 Tax=Lentilactobacillus kisonensis F0435 TaxID=797516 RepID=H1LIV1_9LACO|nr:hypothetical protein HMPREF9104_02543 [Lentilactobacillus kisonensis F0435]